MSKTTPPPTSKRFYLSKTFWMNTTAMLSMMVPTVRDWLAANPVEVISVIAAANVILRFVTSGKISLVGENGSGGASASLLVVSCTLIGVLGFASISCSSLPPGVTGSIYYIDSNSGAKGGLNFLDGKATGRVTVPILDPETGEEVGRASVEVPIVIDATK